MLPDSDEGVQARSAVKRTCANFFYNFALKRPLGCLAAGHLTLSLSPHDPIAGKFRLGALVGMLGRVPDRLC